jgi:hypothetical protein
MARRIIAILATAALLGMPAAARADISFTGSDLAGHAFSADFSISGTTLTLVETNTGTALSGPPDVITAMFFDIAGNPSLTPVSAVMTSGSTLVWSSSLSYTNLGDEYAFATSSGGQFNGVTLTGTGSVGTITQLYGVSSSGLSGAFGQGDIIDSSQTDIAKALGQGNGKNLDGTNFGLIPAGATWSSLSSNLQSNAPLVSNSVTITFTIPSGISESDISNVIAWYGTSNNADLTIPGGPPPQPPGAVPAPPALALLLSGLGSLGAFRFFRRKRDVELAA